MTTLYSRSGLNITITVERVAVHPGFFLVEFIRDGMYTILPFNNSTNPTMPRVGEMVEVQFG